MRLRGHGYKRKLRKALSWSKGFLEYSLVSKLKSLPPKSMIINLTYWCNSRCTMCNIWKMKPKNELSFEEWQRIMDDKIFHQIESLTISGGEPTLSKDFLKLAELFMDSMPKLKTLGVITNGFQTELIVSKLTKLAKLCKKRKIHLSISVSIDGIGKMHERVRRIPNAFDKSKKTLMKLNKLKSKYDLSVGSGSMILKQNLSEIDKTEKWFEAKKIPLNFQIVGFHDTFVKNLDTQNKVDFINKQTKKLVEVLKRLAKPQYWRDFRAYYWQDMVEMYEKKKPRTTPCPFLKDHFVLDSFGDVYYCLSVKKIGNVREGKSVSEVYYSPENVKFRRSLPKTHCQGCNSGCNTDEAIAKDMKKYLWFRLTGKPWYGWKSLLN